MKSVVKPQPVYLLAGGHGSRRSGPDPLLQHVFEETGHPQPSVAYIGAASDDDPEFFKWISTAFKQSGAGPIKLAAMASRHDDLGHAADILKTSDCIFISGGDVEAGMTLLQERAMIPLLLDLYKSGKPFFGLSAGSIMLAQSWIRWSDPDDDNTAEPFDCLGIAPVLCDMHAENEEWEELKALLRLQPQGHLGFGLSSGTALQVNPDGSLKAFGGPVIRLKRHANGVESLPNLKP